MLIDFDLEFTTSGGQAVTAAAIGTRVIDKGGNVDIGAGEPIVPFFRVTDDADFNPTTSVTVNIEGADDDGLTTNNEVLSTITVLVASLTADSIHRMPPLIPGFSKRYFGCRVTPNGGDATTGKLIVGLLGSADNRAQDGAHML